MRKVPSLNYEKVIKALQRDGWVVARQARQARQKGSHIKVTKTYGC
jgi:predicted RNA binding protein YcfA (HicA-like mRNA interferase family)